MNISREINQSSRLRDQLRLAFKYNGYRRLLVQRTSKIISGLSSKDGFYVLFGNLAMERKQFHTTKSETAFIDPCESLLK